MVIRRQNNSPYEPIPINNSSCSKLSLVSIVVVNVEGPRYSFGGEFAVAVSLSRVVDLRRSPRLKVAASLRQFCLALDILSVSMEVGTVLAKRRIQGVLFPSVVGTDANLVVYVQNCRRGSLAIMNADELRKKVKEMARRLRGVSISDRLKAMVHEANRTKWQSSWQTGQNARAEVEHSRTV